jgi:hypothetical protein
VTQKSISIAEWRKLQPIAKGRARGVHVKGEMNATERAFASWCENEKLAKIIWQWWFEEITFLLAFDLRYTPDFMVHEVDTSSIVFYECKASYVQKDTGKIKTLMEDDSNAKIKMAATKYPLFLFRFAIRLPNGEWKINDVKPLDNSIA